jgi:hypothetical protein
MREVDRRARRSPGERLLDRVVQQPELAPRREVVHAGHHEARYDLRPAIPQDGVAGILEEAHAAVDSRIPLVVAGDGPHPERCAQALEDREQRLDLADVAVDQVSIHYHDVRLHRVDTIDEALHPPRADERSEVDVRDLDQGGAVALGGKPRETDLVVPHHRVTQAKAQRGRREHGRRHERPTPHGGRDL